MSDYTKDSGHEAGDVSLKDRAKDAFVATVNGVGFALGKVRGL